MRSAWKIVKAAFGIFGFDISRKRILRRSFQGALANLRNLGLMPATIIDAGVADGTPELYAAFPEPRLILVDPLKEYEHFMKEIVSRRGNAEYVLAALSRTEGETIIRVHPAPSSSSLYRQSIDFEIGETARTVPTITIDKLVREKKLRGPFLLKLDIQGSEIDALEGARATLKDTEAILIEANFFRFYEGAPDFHDIVHWMKNAGFVAYDVWGGNIRPLDNALAQIDLAFVKEDGPFRKSHHFATPDQYDRHIRAVSKADPAAAAPL